MSNLKAEGPKPVWVTVGRWQFQASANGNDAQRWSGRARFLEAVAADSDQLVEVKTRLPREGGAP
jgi:hypothetical protein